ncbi:hypothetical protein [Dyadobacter sp. 3J3]|uniref:hypothetical protein n=1 Tax=Dyadobacter sp. 3J3 TaxID=2606600 RepID=UPI0013570FA0|nr:hypothetical protein [Dyadobacter sp. 3J3]
MFDFYFQSGEFVGDNSDLLSFLSDFVVQIAGTFVGAWFAIKLYRKQTQDQIDKSIKDIENRDLDNMRYLDFMLRNSISAADGLVKSFKQLAEEFSKANNSLPDLEIFTSYSDIDRIAKVINQSDFYHSYNNLNRKYRFDLKNDSLYYVFVNIDSLYHNINNGVAFKKDRSNELEKTTNNVIKIIVLQNTSIELLSKEKEYVKNLRRIRDEYTRMTSISHLDRLYKIQIRTEAITDLINSIDLSKIEESVVNIHNLNSEIKTQLNYLRMLYLNLMDGIVNYTEMFDQSADNLKRHSKHLSNFIRGMEL